MAVFVAGLTSIGVGVWHSKPPKPSPLPVPPAPSVEAPIPAGCECDLSKPMLEPTKGQECQVPWGMDIRFLCWSPKKGDWIFVAQPGGVGHDGETISAACQSAVGWHLVGMRAPSSQSEMVKPSAGICTIDYKATTRIYYQRR